MSALRRLLDRLLPWRRRQALDREIDDEIRFHLEMRTRANRDKGMDPEEARAAAERAFGDPAAVREKGRAHLRRAGPSLDPRAAVESLLRDVQFGFRMLVRNPLPSAVAIASLALGIAVNVTVFSVVYGILFRTLPFEDPSRLVVVRGVNPERGEDDGELTWADLDDLEAVPGLEALGGALERSVTLTGGDRPERLQSTSVTPDLFRLLGVDPQIGRHFTLEDAGDLGFERAVLLSDDLWRERFGGDPAIVGDTIRVNDRELVVAGVMPPGFRFPERDDLWLPLDARDSTDRSRRWVVGIGRLAPGTTMAALRDQLEGVSKRLAADHPESHEGWSFALKSYRGEVVDPNARQLLLAMLGAVGFVLLIACANVANLLLARSADRSREIAVRAALGAGRLRMVRQLLTESLLLALFAGALGALLAHWGTRSIASTIPAGEMVYWFDIRVDGAVLLYTLAIALGTGILFGILPALQASRSRLTEGLKDAGRGTDVSRDKGRLRSALVTAEVALAVVLLVAALLMMRSFLELQSADPGFDETRMLSLRLTLAGDHYDEPAARGTFFQAVVDELSATPGIESAAVTSAIPADDGGPRVSVWTGADERVGDQGTLATAVISMPGLFETLGTPLLAGRGFTAEEGLSSESRVAIVGERLAQRLWGGRDAVGGSLYLSDDEDARPYRVVGIAPDLQYEEFGEAGETARLQLHLPYAAGGWRSMSVLVRAEADPAALVEPVREGLATLDPLQAPYDIMTMPERHAFTTWPQRLFGKLFAGFGVVALVLAVAGVYGVIAYAVSRRTHEIGVRMALGARPRQVLRQVLGDGTRLAAIGVAIGLIGAWGFGQALESVLFGVSAGDPWVFLLGAIALPAAALVASYVPARRAARLDPTRALRQG